MLKEGLSNFCQALLLGDQDAEADGKSGREAREYCGAGRPGVDLDRPTTRRAGELHAFSFVAVFPPGHGLHVWDPVMPCQAEQTKPIQTNQT